MTAYDGSWLQKSWSKWQPEIIIHGIKLTADGDPIIPRVAALMELSERNKDVKEFQFDNGEWLSIRL